MDLSFIIVGTAVLAFLTILAAIGLAWITNGKDAAELVYQHLLGPIARAFRLSDE